MADGRFNAKDYRGKRFGLIEPLSRTKRQADDFSYVWKVKCACGYRFELPASRFARIYSCGCRQRPNSGRFVAKDLTGYRNKMAEAIAPTDKRDPTTGNVIWKLRCDCGREFERQAGLITRGHTKSCGCKQFREKTGRTPIPNNGAYVTALWGHIRVSARARGLEFGLSKEMCRELFEENCSYCGDAPRVGKVKNLAGTYAWSGVDRIDSAMGYVEGNVVACCKHCNIAKARMLPDEFKAWVRRVYNHFGSQ